ncbi:aldose epimerase family protein [Mucilaginibacter sp. OK098]|uniref:aldose epimerase family protein n=1 Tax=Mucilaginibacter sp. OK098 TaxID=1855297 RepID=UPI000916A63F|nr:aldose epimerase family protein [Mucilaginibacter sp. OK098]SHN27648.1 aldose 1-epimerase [Mucilaginibacter sp. OK098]
MPVIDPMITLEKFGIYDDKELLLFTVKNANGAFIQLTNYGATIVSVVAPGRNGELEHVIAGFDEPEDYLVDKCYIGSTIGRFANRIGNAAFKLDGKQYHLEANDNTNTNHGGGSGYNLRVFDYKIEDDKLIFTLNSPDGDGGFPGNLGLTVSYQWTENNQLKITYLAETDQLTIANFTNHAYFNLSGKGGSMLNHQLTIYADQVLETDKEYIPTGKVIPAGKSALSVDRIGDKIKENKGEGFNHYYILNNQDDNIRLAAVLDDENSGRRLNVYTTYPGLMFYTGDFLESIYPGHLGKPYKPFDGLCLECQYYPDAPNHDSFPSAALKPGEQYREEIIYEFTLIPDIQI